MTQEVAIKQKAGVPIRWNRIGMRSRRLAGVVLMSGLEVAKETADVERL